ncbi:uncharacterized protein LOC126803782 [Argentina anserina]|uniref:uncharacterized protein LOC126803782 n=1 Tax=Argentina anserina TaxID=57926 RepID=UPI00217641EA|nr:uncharacterized protein LOC126803782 [Potentilla anserina]
MEFQREQRARAEAERWLSTAVKLLTTRDLHGTKSFAIRARESDPRLGAADQLIAVADTLLTGESRIHNNQPDWYAILQLSRRRTHSPELVATQYRRLALLLSPQANRFPFADQAFRLVCDAWAVLSNPSNKAFYDHHLNSPQMHAQQPPVPEKNGVSCEAGSAFWTACPYCYHLFEYSRAYEECMLRCQNCKRAFHAVVISSPPVMDNGDTGFCCWAYFPMGLSPTGLKDTSNWSPFSAIFACPLPPAKNRAGRPKKAAPGPRVYIEDDEDDAFLNDISDPSEESDDEWHTDKRRRTRTRRSKRKASTCATPARASERIRKVAQNVAVANGAADASPCNGESSKRVTARTPGASALGKLDLNVEFSNNEVEEPAAQTANGEEDNIEGIGFFEGLDEFLSSLPLLNVVGDNKGKS